MAEIDIFLNRIPEWFRTEGPDSDIVTSSRIRVARNFKGLAYTPRLTLAEQDSVLTKVEEALSDYKAVSAVHFFRYQKLEDIDKQFLAERHLVSLEHIGDKGHKAAAISDDEKMSTMILEEDHLRLQAFESGFNLVKAWRIISALDDHLQKKIEFAFDSKLGFLTACPTNVGTGLRASCMVHIPALVLTKQIHKVVQALTKLNLATRGLYGEGTQAIGDYFQFSNQMTLGQNEEEIIQNLESVIRQVIDHEREARQHMLEKKKGKFEDQIWRALGVLKSARIISSSEATQYLSMVHLGLNTGVLKGPLNRMDLNMLFELIQPAHLQKMAQTTLNASERDLRRAEIIRDRLTKLSL